MNILEGLKIKKSSLETHVGTISIKFMFKTLALDEIIKEMHMYQEEERISKEPRKENSQAALCQGKKKLNNSLSGMYTVAFRKWQEHAYTNKMKDHLIPGRHCQAQTPDYAPHW